MPELWFVSKYRPLYKLHIFRPRLASCQIRMALFCNFNAAQTDKRITHSNSHSIQWSNKVCTALITQVLIHDRQTDGNCITSPASLDTPLYDLTSRTDFFHINYSIYCTRWCLVSILMPLLGRCVRALNTELKAGDRPCFPGSETIVPDAVPKEPGSSDRADRQCLHIAALSQLHVIIFIYM